MRSWRRRSGDGAPTRIENSLLVRFSVSTLLAGLTGGVATLLVLRRWTDLEWTLSLAIMIAVGLFVIFLSPEALVVDDREVRDESGWRRRGWRMRREAVSAVRWEEDPDLFDPPRLVFVDAEGAELRSASVEFDRERVVAALRAHGWPVVEQD